MIINRLVELYPFLANKYANDANLELYHCFMHRKHERARKDKEEAGIAPRPYKRRKVIATVNSVTPADQEERTRLNQEMEKPSPNFKTVFELQEKTFMKRQRLIKDRAVSITEVINLFKLFGHEKTIQKECENNF